MMPSDQSIARLTQLVNELEALKQSNSELKAVNLALKKQLKEASSRLSELESKNFRIEEKDDYIRELQGELLRRPRPADLIRRKVSELGFQEKLMLQQRDPKSNIRYWALARLLEVLD